MSRAGRGPAETRRRRQIRDRAACLPARLDLPLPGRGTRPEGGRDCLRGFARPLRHPLLAGLQGQGRLPHADGLGSGCRQCRVFDRQAVAAGARRHRARAADVQVKDPASVLSRYRAMLASAQAPCGAGARLDQVPRCADDVLAFIREGTSEKLLCVFNFAEQERRWPLAGRRAGLRRDRTARAERPARWRGDQAVAAGQLCGTGPVAGYRRFRSSRPTNQPLSARQ